MATSSLPPKLIIDGDTKGCFCQSPKTPTATSSLYRSSTHYHGRKQGDESRKRARGESYSTSARATPLSESAPGWKAHSIATQTPESPAPLINSRYELANGLDTTTLAASTAQEHSGSCSDLTYLHGYWNANLDESSASYFPSAPNPLARERNGHARVQQPQDFDPTAPWRISVLSAFSNVASKLISFCTSVPFRGFYSGGGQGYAISRARGDFDSSSALGESWHALGTPEIEVPTSLQPVPGPFPSDNFIPDYMSSPSAYTQPRDSHSSKKHKRESSSESASQEKWILVADSRTRKQPPSSASPVTSRRLASRAGMRRVLAPSRVNLLGTHSPASTAALRSPGSTPKRLRLNREIDGTDPQGKPRTLAQQEDGPVLSPVAMEARRYAQKVRRKEVEENRELKKLNSRLKDMIREGNEALGTRVSIDNISEDESGSW